MKGIANKSQRQRRRTAAEYSGKGAERRLVTAVQVAEEADLAWALAEAAQPHLSAVERNEVYVAIGVGEAFAAIHYLITAAARKRISCPAELVQRCQSWLDVYIGHHDEPYLRSLVEDVLSPHAIRFRQPLQ
jgi:hypothetical protein